MHMAVPDSSDLHTHSTRRLSPKAELFLETHEGWSRSRYHGEGPHGAVLSNEDFRRSMGSATSSIPPGGGAAMAERPSTPS